MTKHMLMNLSVSSVWPLTGWFILSFFLSPTFSTATIDAGVEADPGRGDDEQCLPY